MLLMCVCAQVLGTIASIPVYKLAKSQVEQYGTQIRDSEGREGIERFGAVSELSSEIEDRSPQEGGSRLSARLIPR